MNPTPPIPALASRTGVRVPELDGLRGLAILLVLGIHWFGVTNPEVMNHVAFFWIAYGFSGVDLFFVLSGFLVGGILLDARESPSYFRTFYFRRACRILPLYYLFFLYIILQTQLSTGIPPEDARQLPYYAVFLQNFTLAFTPRLGLPNMEVTWSLAIEEQFYLTLPLLIKYMPRQRLPYILGGAIAAVPVIRTLVAEYYGSFAGYTLMVCRADDLLLGVLGAWAYRDLRAWNWLLSHRHVLRTTVVALGLGIFSMRAVLRENIYSFGMVSVGYTLFGLFYASLLLLTLTDSGSHIAKVFRFTPLRFVGTLAYCVYLIHGPVNTTLHHYILSDVPQTRNAVGLAVTLLSIPAVTLIAIASWYFIEKPLIAIGHRRSYGNERNSPN